MLLEGEVPSGPVSSDTASGGSEGSSDPGCTPDEGKIQEGLKKTTDALIKGPTSATNVATSLASLRPDWRTNVQHQLPPLLRAGVNNEVNGTPEGGLASVGSYTQAILDGVAGGQEFADGLNLDCSPKGPGGGATGGSFGDPHLRTLDGRAYNLQVVGELVLVRDTAHGLEGAAAVGQGTREHLAGGLDGVPVERCPRGDPSRHR